MAFYNVQLIEYPTGYQLRCYMRPIQACRKVRTSELYHDSEINEKVFESSREYKKKRSALVSQNRTVNKIYELARSNVWSYFVTLTVDPKKYDNTIDNYDLFTKGVRKYFNNLKFLYAPDLKYLIVPELHKDGKKLHFHALLSDVGGIKFVFSGKVSVGKYIYDVSECSWGKKIYNMPLWKYGFSSATVVGDSARCAGYLAKYITKDLCIALPNKHRYWNSYNLYTSKSKVFYIAPDTIDKFLLKYASAVNYTKVVNIDDINNRVTYYEFSNDTDFSELTFNSAFVEEFEFSDEVNRIEKEGFKRAEEKWNAIYKDMASCGFRPDFINRGRKIFSD